MLSGGVRMEAMRQVKLDTLKARIGDADYEVDADAVAEAIVARLLAARTAAESASLFGRPPEPPSSVA
jgi:hypothetical protein